MKNPLDTIKRALTKPAHHHATKATVALSLPKSDAAKQHVAKAAAKAAADKTVATDPNAVHATQLTVKSPKVWFGTLAGATLGGIGGPVGIGVGAGLGFLVERYQILGGPIGKLYDTAKAKIVPPKKAA